jgi:hypothetical protein
MGKTPCCGSTASPGPNLFFALVVFFFPYVCPLLSSVCLLCVLLYGLCGQSLMTLFLLPYSSFLCFCLLCVLLYGLCGQSLMSRCRRSNGQVFQMGASADGILTLLDVKQQQPVCVCVCVCVCVRVCSLIHH